MSEYIPVSLTTVDNEIYRVYVRADVKAYFSIPDLPTDTSPKVTIRKGFKRRISNKKGLVSAVYDTADNLTPVKVKETTLISDPNRRRDIRSGQKIKVPTGLYSIPPSKTAQKGYKGSLRFITINIPQGVRNYDIARWIRTQFSAHTPDYFITASGVRFSTQLSALPVAKK